jgi:hypothetical protein
MKMTEFRSATLVWSGTGEADALLALFASARVAPRDQEGPIRLVDYTVDDCGCTVFLLLHYTVLGSNVH